MSRAAAFLVLAGLLLCQPVRAGAPADAGRVARAWDALLSDLVRRERQGPLAAARLIALTGVAMHEAARPACAGEPSLAARIPGMGVPPAPSVAVDDTLAVNSAAAALLRRLLANRGADAMHAIDALETRIAMDHPVAPAVAAAAAEHGRRVADAVASWGAGDAAEPARCAWTSRKRPGGWEPTPPDFRGMPLGACWGACRPMAMESAAVPIDPPTPYSEDPASRFHAEALEVHRTVSRQDPLEQEIALFWADDPGATGTPPAHWLAILDQLGEERAIEPFRFLRARTALGIALHDASVACWHEKFSRATIRPVTYIQRHIEAPWIPLLATPPFPEYPSGHAVFSAAAATVLAAAVGDGPFEDRTRAERGHAPRRYASFDAAAREAALSRLYGGIHFRPACDNGLVQGREVGRRVLARLGIDAPR